METPLGKPAAATDGNETVAILSRETVTRREFLAGAAAIGIGVPIAERS
jgi:hypothetical protein